MSIAVAANWATTGFERPEGPGCWFTDYVVVRVSVGKLSEKSKAKLAISGEQAVPSFKKRISELEALAEWLRDENVQLPKSGQAATPAPVGPAARPSAGIAKTPDPTAIARAFQLSSSGNRWNQHRNQQEHRRGLDGQSDNHSYRDSSPVTVIVWSFLRAVIARLSLPRPLAFAHRSRSGHPCGCRKSRQPSCPA